MTDAELTFEDTLKEIEEYKNAKKKIREFNDLYDSFSHFWSNKLTNALRKSFRIHSLNDLMRFYEAFDNEHQFKHYVLNRSKNIGEKAFEEILRVVNEKKGIEI